MKECLGGKKDKVKDLWVKIFCNWKRQKIRMGWVNMRMWMWGEMRVGGFWRIIEGKGWKGGILSGSCGSGFLTSGKQPIR